MVYMYVSIINPRAVAFCMFLGPKLWDPTLEEHMEMHAQLVPQDQISGFIWHETYLKHLDSHASKGAQVCANRLISWVSNFSSPLSGYIHTYFHTF